jgi:hypothetical protein
MNPSEAWALLTLRSKHFARTPGGHGGTTASDIAALLAGLDREPFLMGMAADLGDFSALQQIELVLWERARQMGERENWDPPRGEFTVRRMAAVALYEAVKDPRCYVCNGTAEMTISLADYPGMILAPSFRAITDTSGAVRCPACIDGKIRLSGRKKADLAGINKDMWTRVWARRYEPIFQIANGWRETAHKYLRDRIREEEAEVDTSPAHRESTTFDGHRRDGEKPKEISNSCMPKPVDGITRPRRGTSEESDKVINLDLGALQRSTLRLNRKKEVV